MLGLIGPNGAGKTTIFELISGHQDADERRSFATIGVDISAWHPMSGPGAVSSAASRMPRLFPSLTVYETLLVALEQKLEVRSAVLGAFGAPQVRRAERRVQGQGRQAPGAPRAGAAP